MSDTRSKPFTARYPNRQRLSPIKEDVNCNNLFVCFFRESNKSARRPHSSLWILRSSGWWDPVVTVKPSLTINSLLFRPATGHGHWDTATGTRPRARDDHGECSETCGYQDGRLPLGGHPLERRRGGTIFTNVAVLVQDRGGPHVPLINRTCPFCFKSNALD
ncbi:hypothetical protein N656DRAFT_34479 [Canariomyces notabilis]|uniref:Uncharacterized protein n=1 Tax=Canariomyces notabilis TaxID=2074819 RepID=A0AAN6YYG0_9PEZI|nr:hypothetical protein N656DRAFT_34479 [Canariomyces arenarius]